VLNTPDGTDARMYVKIHGYLSLITVMQFIGDIFYMVVIIMEVVTQAKYFPFMMVQMYTFERVITLVLAVVMTLIILSRV